MEKVNKPCSLNVKIMNRSTSTRINKVAVFIARAPVWRNSCQVFSELSTLAICYSAEFCHVFARGPNFLSQDFNHRG